MLISGGHTHTRNVLPVRIRATDLCDGEILESESQRRRRRPAIAQRIASRPRGNGDDDVDGIATHSLTHTSSESTPCMRVLDVFVGY